MQSPVSVGYLFVCAHVYCFLCADLFVSPVDIPSDNVTDVNPPNALIVSYLPLVLLSLWGVYVNM